MISTIVMQYALLVSGGNKSWTLYFENIELCETAQQKISKERWKEGYSECIKVSEGNKNG